MPSRAASAFRRWFCYRGGMTTNEHLEALKAQCQEAAKWFTSLTSEGKPTEQDAFNAAVLKALKHAHDAIEAVATAKV